MNRLKHVAVGAAVGGLLLGLTASYAQTTTFRTYRCADGTQFIVGFYPYDSSAFLEIDGDAIKLPKRFAVSGSRYSAHGVTMRVSKAGRTSVKRPKRPETACDLT